MVTSFNIYGRSVNSLTGDDVKITNRFWLPRSKLKGFMTRNIGPVDANDYVGGNYGAAVNLLSKGGVPLGLIYKKEPPTITDMQNKLIEEKSKNPEDILGSYSI